MRILIFGAGAIGSLLGHLLEQAGHQVTLVGRVDYVRAVQTHGLILEEQGRALVVHPKAVETVAELAADEYAWDLRLLTVKAYDTLQAAQTLASAVSPETPLLLLQNGVGGEELAQQALPQTPIVSGVITWPVSILAAGHIAIQSRRGGASLAPTHEGQHVEPWVQLFHSIGVKAVLCPDYRAQKWSKLLLNMLANAVPAILDVPPDAAFKAPRLFAIERAAYLEALDVMRALQLPTVAFPDYPVPALAWAMRHLPEPILRPLLGRLVAGGRGEKKPSLQIDLLSGRRRSEVLYLNGAVVTYAAHVGLAAPVNQVLVNTLLGIAAGSIAWDEFRGRPERLVAEVNAAKGE